MFSNADEYRMLHHQAFVETVCWTKVLVSCVDMQTDYTNRIVEVAMTCGLCI